MNQYIDFAEARATDALPSPKGAALHILQLCSRENVATVDLAKAIQGDPVLAGRIIKLANSTGLNRSRPVVAVSSDVLVLVGVNAVRQLVLGISLISEYAGGDCPAFDYAEFWSRSIAMACAGQALAAGTSIAAPAEIFTCGLLAGIGRLGFASLRPSAYSDLLQRYSSDNDAVLTAEKQTFGMNHLELAAAMMEDWKIPRLFSQAVVLHEQPPAMSSALPERQQQMTGLLRLAAGIADVCVAPEHMRERCAAGLPALAEGLEIEREELTPILAAVAQEWLEWSAMLGVPARPLPAIEQLIS